MLIGNIGAGYNINKLALKTLIPNKENAGGGGKVSNNDKKNDRGGDEGADEVAINLNQPITYAGSGIDLEMVLSMLEAKWQIIQDVIKSFKPDEEDEKAENEFWDKKDLKKLEDKAHFAGVMAQRAVEDMQALVNLLKSPTSNPGARAGMVLAELQKISGAIGGLIDEVGKSLGELKDVNVSDPAAKEQKTQLLNSLVKLDGSLKDIYSACKKVEHSVDMA